MFIEIFLSSLLIIAASLILYYLLAIKIKAVNDTTSSSITSLDTKITNLANAVSNNYVPTTQYLPLQKAFTGFQHQVDAVQATQSEEIASLQDNMYQMTNGNTTYQSIYFA